MTDDDVAAGLFKLAKAHRRIAHDMRRRANLNLKAHRKASPLLRANAINAAEEVRLRASKEDVKAAFLHRAACLAKLGAASYRWNATPLAMASRPSLAGRGLSLLASLLVPKPKGY